MKRDVSIQIIRIISMLLIILCHLVQEMNNNYLAMSAQFLNVGVYIFLFLSGYLYGNKKLDNACSWLYNRFVKLMIPIYLFLIPVFLIYIYQDIFKIKYVFIHLFNLQRIFGTGIGLGHLWFMTVLMFCYLITPLLNKYKKNIIKDMPITIIILILSIITCFINKETGQILLYMFAYYIGYIYRNKKEVIFHNFIGTSCILFLIMIRLAGKMIFDQSVLYDAVIVSITQLGLAFLIFLMIKKIVKLLKISNSPIINHFDNISYYIYICHYIFFVGPVRLINNNHLITSIIFTIIIIYIVSLCLQKVSAIAINKILANNKKEKLT